MKTKWYIGALVVMLTLFGISQENLMVPNQEIVLQFSHNQVSSGDTELAIANIKEQLETIGVSNFSIRKEDNRRLVISYYSDATVANVKELFSAQAFVIDYASSQNNEQEFPTKQTYNLDISEIQKSTDTGFHSNGKLIFELKQDYDRSSNPNVLLYAVHNNSTEQNVEIAVAYKLNNTIAKAINTIPHEIPEGRAGPML